MVWIDAKRVVAYDVIDHVGLLPEALWKWGNKNGVHEPVGVFDAVSKPDNPVLPVPPPATAPFQIQHNVSGSTVIFFMTRAVSFLFILAVRTFCISTPLG